MDPSPLFAWRWCAVPQSELFFSYLLFYLETVILFIGSFCFLQVGGCMATDFFAFWQLQNWTKMVCPAQTFGQKSMYPIQGVALGSSQPASFFPLSAFPSLDSPSPH